MKPWFFFLILTASFALYSCKNSDKQEAEEKEDDIVAADTSSFERVDTVFSNETINFLNNSDFSAFARSKSAQFDWSKFHMVTSWKDDSMLVTPFIPEKGYYEAYGRFLKYSPDSSLFVDLDSYNIDIIKDKQGRWIGTAQGPDTEVSLIDPKKKEKKRLLFAGPGTFIEEASWIDNENIALMGLQEGDSSSKRTAVVWRYHLPTSTYFQYELPNPAAATQLMRQWRKERLKGVIMQ
jgi:hypothetical protein